MLTIDRNRLRARPSYLDDYELCSLHVSTSGCVSTPILRGNILTTCCRKSFYSSVILYNVGTCVLKISILLQLRRIFRNPLMNKLTIIGLVFQTSWAVTISVLLPLICNPAAAFWDTSIEGKCLNELQVWYVMAAVNLVTDFIVFSMPLPVIKNLQLPKRQKILLMGVFCLGFL